MVNVREQIRALLARHCTGLLEDVEAIAAVVSASRAEVENEKAALTHAIELTHGIKSASGSLGFHDVSARAAQLEICLKALAAQRGETTQMEQALAEFSALQMLARTLTPQMSTLYDVEGF